MRKLIDGQEYPVAKGGIVKKGFDREAAIERCVAYLHGLYHLPGCPRYTSDRITSVCRYGLRVPIVYSLLGGGVPIP